LSENDESLPQAVSIAGSSRDRRYAAAAVPNDQPAAEALGERSWRMRRVAARPDNEAQARMLAMLRDDGPRSRAELADATGQSRTKLGVQVDRLVTLGLAEDGGPAVSRGGRRSTMVRLPADMRFLGIDIGATSVDVALTDGELRVLARASQACDVRSGPAPVLDAVVALAAKLRADGGQPDIFGAGVGVPGPVSFRDGAPVVPPLMPGWNHVPVRDMLSQELGCPVIVDNDVNIMALGERQSGVARGAEDFLFIKIGTGIGCGVVLGGQVHRGVSGSAGDIGHIRVEDYGPACACGNIGCLEAFFGGAALAREATAAAKARRSPVLAERLAAEGALTAVDVGIAAAAGDPVAVEMVREGGRRLGQVIAGLVSFVNPGLVVIGGGVAGLGHTLLAEVRSVVYRRSLPLATENLPIVLSELGDLAGVVGAARLASDLVFAAPA
jgi:glucokinase-like ROK family protein